MKKIIISTVALFLVSPVHGNNSTTDTPTSKVSNETKSITLVTNNDDNLSLYDTYITMGNKYLNQGEFNKAIEAYTKVIIINPKDDIAYRLMQRINGEQKKYPKMHPKVIEFYEKMIEINPKDAKTYYYKGKAYQSKINSTKAIESYEKAISINPESYGAYYELGMLYLNNDNKIEYYPKAIEAYKKSCI